MADTYSFAVDTTPYCCWGDNLENTQKDFLSNLDPEHFGFMADVYASHLEGDNAEKATLAIRTTYGHALETLFALLSATIQAPDCIVPWLLKYQNRELRSFVRKVSSGEKILSRLRLQPVSWEAVANVIHSPTAHHGDAASQDVAVIAQFWKQLAHDFTDDVREAEYNSIKHGMRVRTSKFGIQAGLEPKPGTPCPPDQMTLSLSGSGSMFYVPVPVSGDKRNMQLSHVNRAWSAKSLALRIQLITISLDNIATYLKLRSGISLPEASMKFPQNKEQVSESWKSGSSLLSMNFSANIEVKPAHLVTAEQILASYDDSDGI